VEKSIPGTVAKTLLFLAPYFIPGISEAYIAASIIAQLGQNLPQIAKSFDWSKDGDAYT